MSPRILDRLLLATLFVLTWEKIRWETPAFTMTATNLMALLFVAAFVVDRVRRRDTAVTPAAATLCGFMLAFAVVYLAGYFDLQDRTALEFWLKGLGSWVVHFAFLICGVAHLARRGRPLFMSSIKWFTGGLVLNCVYGVLQLVLVIAAGINLDKLVVARITAGQGGIGGINVFGKVGAGNIYRVNALTADPNHLGVMLCVPLLLLLPYYVNDRRGRRRLGLVLLFMFVVQVLTLSRSAAVGDAVGLVVLAAGGARFLPQLRTVGICALVAAVLAGAAYQTNHFVHTVLKARLSTSGSGTNAHLEFYRLVPPALDPHPAFGMGFNSFAVFYEFVTGRTDYGPHSFWIATLVETGIVGLTVYLAYFAYITASAARVSRASDPRHRPARERPPGGDRRHGGGQLLLSDDVVRLLLRDGADRRRRRDSVRPRTGASAVAGPADGRDRRQPRVIAQHHRLEVAGHHHARRIPADRRLHPLAGRHSHHQLRIA